MATGDSLFEFNAFEEWGSQEILPKLATDWWVNKDGTLWTLKLKEANFDWDGELKAFICEDAQFMIDTIRLGHDDTGDELRRSPRAGYIQRVSETTCVDDRTLQIKTEGVLPSLPASLAMGYFHLKDKDYFGGNLEAMLDDHGPEIGPFLFDKYQPDEIIRFVRNPNFHNQPYPYLDAYEIKILGSSTARDAAFRVGRGEHAAMGTGTSLQAKADGFLEHTDLINTHGGRYVQTNFTREPWNDPRFSQALRCAIDAQKAIDTGYDGFGFYGGIFSGLEAIPGHSKWQLSDQEIYDISFCHDVRNPIEERQQMARDLLKEMGFDEDNPAEPYTYIWTPASPSYFWPSMLDDLAKVNIIPDWEPMETARAYDKNYAGEFDFNFWSYSVARADADTWLFEHYISHSDRNYGKYTNLETDAMIDLQSRTLDAGERMKIINEIETILLKDNAKIVLSHYGSMYFWAPWVNDWRYSIGTTGATLYRMERVWIDAAKRAELGKD
jgi:ABC-type transport system substrate-binding protein